MFDNIKDKLLHRNFDELGDIKSHVLGEPPLPEDDNYYPTARYTPPGMQRMQTERRVNIGTPAPLANSDMNGPLPPEPNLPPIGMRPAPSNQFDQRFNSSGFNEPADAPMSINNDNSRDMRHLEDKLDFMRQEMKTLREQMELANERLKSVVRYLEEQQRRY